MIYRVKAPSDSEVSPPKGHYPTLDDAIQAAMDACHEAGVNPDNIVAMFRFIQIEQVDPGQVGITIANTMRKRRKAEAIAMALGAALDGQGVRIEYSPEAGDILLTKGDDPPISGQQLVEMINGQ